MSRNGVVHLHESVFAAPKGVDREACVIRGCKILGASSPNKYGQAVDGTDYLLEARRAAAPLYEGIQVYGNHNRKDPRGERLLEDLVGTFRNIVVESDGTYGDLHYYPSSRHAPLILDVAKSNPSGLGFSHNADGKGRVVGRKYLIESIPAVRSVDVVTRPATTKGLFESQETTMATVRELLESRKFKDKALLALLEDDMGPGMDVAAPTDDWREHLKSAVAAILSDESLDEGACKAKIGQLLKLIKGEDSPAEVAAGDASAAMESIEKDRKELATLRQEKTVRVLCESQQFAPSPVQLKALVALDAEADRKAFIAESKKATKAPAGPRSNSLRTLTESQDGGDDRDAKLKAVTDGKSFAEALRRR
jgi:hypothetical protein